MDIEEVEHSVGFSFKSKVDLLVGIVEGLNSGGKLSKRCPEFSLIGNVHSLRKAGYLPSVIINWLTSTGGAVPYNTDNITHFDDRCSDNQYNCELVISELASQRLTKLGEVGASNTYSEQSVLLLAAANTVEQLKEGRLSYPLSQVIFDGQQRVITYASRKLDKRETRYSITHREMLALVDFFSLLSIGARISGPDERRSVTVVTEFP
ncbi:unnamed protein product [Trichobilharzia regenti]|nr:unnamed protein product [Trichobilharzia regenti]